jgi:hypothetical protein
MNRKWCFIMVLTCFYFGARNTTAQEPKKDNRDTVFVQLEILDLNDGLPGASSMSTSPVGGRFGLDTTTEKDPSGKQVYLRAIDGRSQWVQTNAIELTLEINENGKKRIDKIRLDNIEPKTLVLREDPASGWRELLRVIPVWPRQVTCQISK